MTDLTEKLNAERLYYVKKKNGKIVIRQAHLYSCLRTEKATPFVDFDDNDIEKVLALVPSYEELQELKEYEKTIKSYNGMPIDYTIACETVNKLLDEKDVLKKENARLKEFIQKCYSFIDIKKPNVVKLLEEFEEVLE